MSLTQIGFLKYSCPGINMSDQANNVCKSKCLQYNKAGISDFYIDLT